MRLCLALALSLLAFSAKADPAGDLAREKQLSAAYLETIAKEPGAQVIDEGVVVRPIFKSDSKVSPTVSQNVQVSYHLSDRTGKLIEESISSDELADFPLYGLIRCWQIAIPKMTVGSFYKITCPSATAYGDRGVGAILPGAALTFRITLFGVRTPTPR